MSTAPRRAAVINDQHGRMQAQLQRESARLLDTIKRGGQVQPVCVVNFNPVSLTLPQALTNWTVPREGHFGSPDEAKPKTIAIHFNGKHYLPAYIVIKDAVLSAKYEPVRVEDGEPKTGSHPYAILPIERGYEYWDAYNNTDRSNMGGVIVFASDRIDPLLQTSPDAKISIAKKIPIEGGGTEFAFEEVSLRDVFKETLTKQRAYYERKYQEATDLDNDPQRKYGMPDERHRLWAQFGLDMGFRDTPPRWMERAVQEGAKRCPRCQLPAQNDAAWFCVCGTPYDAFEAFMAGQDVGEVHLISLPDKQFKEVQKETARRQERIDALRGVGKKKAD